MKAILALALSKYKQLLDKYAFTPGAAIFDCQLGGGEDSPTFRLGIPTSGGVPVEISHSELGNPDFPVQLERTITVDRLKPIVMS